MIQTVSFKGEFLKINSLFLYVLEINIIIGSNYISEYSRHKRNPTADLVLGPFSMVSPITCYHQALGYHDLFIYYCNDPAVLLGLNVSCLLGMQITKIRLSQLCHHNVEEDNACLR